MNTLPQPNTPKAPYLSSMNIERIAYQTIQSFDQSLLTQPQKLNIDLFAEKYLRLKLDFLDLSNNGSILGMMVFSNSSIPVFDTEQNTPKIIQAKAGTVLIENCNFQQGEFCVISGPSGSGKSTLLHVLGGLEYPTSGQVFYQGEDLYKYNDNQLSILRRRRFGFVFQAYNLVQELTAMENILLPVMLDKKQPDEAYLDQVINILSIRDRLEHLPGALSGGQQQRVAIARALANKPAILFADEPTGNLDGQSGREVLSLMRYVGHELGVTLILVTHDLNIAEQAERVISLTDGFIAKDSKAGSLEKAET